VDACFQDEKKHPSDDEAVTGWRQQLVSIHLISLFFGRKDNFGKWQTGPSSFWQIHIDEVFCNNNTSDTSAESTVTTRLFDSGTWFSIQPHRPASLDLLPARADTGMGLNGLFRFYRKRARIIAVICSFHWSGNP
jgi:hypothetical protein